MGDVTNGNGNQRTGGPRAWIGAREGRRGGWASDVTTPAAGVGFVVAGAAGGAAFARWIAAQRAQPSSSSPPLTAQAPGWPAGCPAAPAAASRAYSAWW